MKKERRTSHQYQCRGSARFPITARRPAWHPYESLAKSQMTAATAITSKGLRFIAVGSAALAALAFFVLPAVLRRWGALSREEEGWTSFWALPSLLVCMVTAVVCIAFPRKITVGMCLAAVAAHLAFLAGVHPR